MIIIFPIQTTFSSFIAVEMDHTVVSGNNIQIQEKAGTRANGIVDIFTYKVTSNIRSNVYVIMQIKNARESRIY